MTRFLLRRITQGAFVLFLVTLLVYLLFFLGNPESIAHRLCGRQCTPDQVHAEYVKLGLNRPFFAQYGHFLWRLLHGDLGENLVNGVQVTTVLKQAAPITLSLGIGASIVWLVLGVATGVYSSIHARSVADRVFTTLALLFYSIPVFVLGFTLILIFFYQLTTHGHAWFPASDYVGLTQDPFQWFRHLILPWATLGLISAAAYARLSRTSMLEVLGEDYIRTARAKGLSERRVVFRHALRSALTPVITQFGIDVGVVLGGAILTETVFGLPGLGYEAVHAINDQNLHLIIGITIIASAAV